MNYKEFANKVREKTGAYKDIDDLTLVNKVIEKYPVYKDQIQFDKTAINTKVGLPKQSIKSKIWESLAIPEKKSTELLGKLESKLPEAGQSPSATGNFLYGLPKTGVSIAKEFVPPFASRASILTAGAARGLKSATPFISKYGSPALKSVGTQLEKLSGAKEGALTEAAKDAGFLFKRGAKKIAGNFYKLAQRAIPYEETIFKGAAKNSDVFDIAKQAIDNGAKIEPQEALIARKALDKVKKTISEDAFVYYRNVLDKIAKSDEMIAKADPLHRKAILAESLQNVFPRNVGGSTSAFKTGTATALAFMPGGKYLTPLFSPIVQGLGATGLGIAGRTLTSPKRAYLYQQILQRMNKGEK